MYDRWYSHILKEKLDRPYVHIMFGARQTGKSTLLKSLLPENSHIVDLSDPGERSVHLSRPGEFIKQCQALQSKEQNQFVFVDEVQSVPSIFDSVQHLYDSNKNRWRFVLCGSSARKLRRTGANLLPGRSFLHRLFPLILIEHQSPALKMQSMESLLPISWKNPPRMLFPPWDIELRLAYGALPGIVAANEQDRHELLRAYAIIHLEEEIRREALVKDWGAFLRFLQLAASESGQILNYANISQEAGISLPTVKEYYQLLEDMFLGFHVLAYSKSPRKNILSTPKFLFFDLGVRHAAAGINPSIDIVRVNPGAIFEQWVGIELWKRLQYQGFGELYYQRSKGGAEIDYIIKKDNLLTPIEVKWSENVSLKDARHLLTFMNENPGQTECGYIICRCSRPLQIHEKILALPWYYI